jgi:hypothetical protein
MLLLSVNEVPQHVMPWTAPFLGMLSIAEQPPENQELVVLGYWHGLKAKHTFKLLCTRLWS